MTSRAGRQTFYFCLRLVSVLLRILDERSLKMKVLPCSVRKEVIVGRATRRNIIKYIKHIVSLNL